VLGLGALGRAGTLTLGLGTVCVGGGIAFSFYCSSVWLALDLGEEVHLTYIQLNIHICNKI